LWQYNCLCSLHYRQIIDSGSSTSPEDHWSDSALGGYLALADDAISIYTGINGNIATRR
jgi:hypothetical protein